MAAPKIYIAPGGSSSSVGGVSMAPKPKIYLAPRPAAAAPEDEDSGFGDFLGNLWEDVETTVTGIPAGIKALRHPIRVAEDIAKIEYETWEPFVSGWWNLATGDLEGYRRDRERFNKIFMAHPLGPLLDASIVFTGGVGRIAALSRGGATTGREIAAAAALGRYAGPRRRIELSFGDPDREPAVARVLPRSAYRAGRMQLTDQALKKLIPANTQFPGLKMMSEFARAARASKNKDKQKWLKAISSPEYYEWTQAWPRLSNKEKAVAGWANRFWFRDDILAQHKADLALRSTPEAKQTLAVLNNPEFMSMYADPSPKLLRALNAGRALMDYRTELGINRGAISPDEAEMSPMRHIRMVQGGKPLTPGVARKELRKLNARLNRLEKTAKPRIVREAKTAGKKEVDASIRLTRQLAREGARNPVLQEKLAKAEEATRAAAEAADDVSTALTHVMQGRVDTNTLANLGITVPPGTSIQGVISTALLRAQFEKELAELQASRAAKNPDPAKLAAIDRQILENEAQIARLDPDRQRVWITRLEKENRTLRSRKQQLIESQAPWRLNIDKDIARVQNDIDGLTGDSMIDPAWQQMRMDALGKLHDMVEPALAKYEKALVREERLERQAERNWVLLERAKGAPNEVRAARENRIQLLRGQRARFNDLLDMEQLLVWSKQELARQKGKLRGGFAPPLPPVPEGHVRLYRGEQEGFLSHEEQGLIPDEDETYYFTEDRNFAAMHDTGGGVRYVDVPREVARDYRGDTGVSLPGTWAVKAQPDKSMATLEDLRQEWGGRKFPSGADVPDPFYWPDVPHTAEKRKMASPGGSISPRRWQADVYNSSGILFRTGMLAMYPDVLGPSFLRMAKHDYYSALHDTAVGMAIPIEKAAALPEGWEWLKTKYGESIPYMEQIRGEHLRETDRAFGDLEDEMEFTSKNADLPETQIMKNSRGDRLMIPKNFADEFRSEFGKGSSGLKRMIEAPLTVWRALILHLRVPWLINNIIGNSILTTLRFMGPDGAKAMMGLIYQTKGAAGVRKALGMKDVRNHLTDEDITELLAELKRGTWVASNEPYAWESRFPTTTKPVLRNAIRAGQGVVGFLPKWDRRTEEALRRLGAEAVLRGSPEVKALYKAMPKQTRSWREAMRKGIETNPDLRQFVIREVNDALGDFLSLSRKERDTIRQWIPFYAWLREITRITGKTAIDTPGRADLLVKLGQVGAEGALTDVPSYLRGAIPMGGLTDTGLQNVLNFRAATPWASAVDAAKAAAFLIPGLQSEQTARAMVGNLNPIFAQAGLGLAEHYQGRGGEGLGGLVDPFTRVGSALPQYRAFFPRDSDLYPDRTRADLFKQLFGDIRRRYDPLVAADYHAEGQ